MIDGVMLDGEEEEEDPGWEYLVLAEQAHCCDAGRARGPWEPLHLVGDRCWGAPLTQ